MYDAIIVGACTAGTYFAGLLAKRGLKRLDIDPKRIEMGWVIDFCAQSLRNIISGIGGMISYWVSGIPFDLMHCAGNFVIALILFEPVRKLVEKLYHHADSQ